MYTGTIYTGQTGIDLAYLAYQNPTHDQIVYHFLRMGTSSLLLGILPNDEDDRLNSLVTRAMHIAVGVTGLLGFAAIEYFHHQPDTTYSRGIADGCLTAFTYTAIRSRVIDHLIIKIISDD